MTNNSDRSAYAYACVVGPLVWIATSLLTQRQEAWDSLLYWGFAYPVLAMAVALITLKVPRRPWRWALVIMLAQAPVLFVSNPSGNLLPLGILAFVLLSLPLMVVAAISSRIAGKLRARRDR